MNICKKCGQRVPNSHKGEFNEHDNLCRKCWHIKHSKYKDVKNKASDLFPDKYPKEEE